MPAPRLIGRTILATALLGAPLVPAIAQAEPTAPPSVSALHLSVSEDRSATFHDALLTCEPSGGTHPRADLACQSVTRAHGDFQALQNQHANAMCPLIYQPVTARAQGRWGNTSVNFTKTYPNACVLRAETGVVFEF